MTTHRYERSAILGDFTRGGFGLLVTAGPVLFLPMVWWLAAAFAICAVLFGIYLFRTWQRGGSVIEVDDEGIRSTGPFGRAIGWESLDSLDLRYFATRRDKEGGWMQLRLRGGGSTLAAESSLGGFETVVTRAVAAAVRNRVALSDVTRENLRALGVAAGGSPQPMSQGPQSGDAASEFDDRLGMR